MKKSNLIGLCLALALVIGLASQGKAQTTLINGSVAVGTVTSSSYYVPSTIDSTTLTFGHQDSVNVRFRARPVLKIGTTDITSAADTVLVDVYAKAGAGVYAIPYHRLRDAFSGKCAPLGWLIDVWHDPDATALESKAKKEILKVREFK